MLLLSSFSLTGYGLHRVFCFARDAGYSGIDITITKGNFDVLDAQYMQSLCKAFDMKIYSISVDIH